MSLHPSFHHSCPQIVNFDDAEQWKLFPSAKLLAAVQIIKYHAESEGRKPMVAVDGVMQDGPPGVMEGHREGDIDKIVVYSYFNTNTTHIRKVSIGLSGSLVKRLTHWF